MASESIIKGCFKLGQRVLSESEVPLPSLSNIVAKLGNERLTGSEITSVGAEISLLLATVARNDTRSAQSLEDTFRLCAELMSTMRARALESVSLEDVTDWRLALTSLLRGLKDLVAGNSSGAATTTPTQPQMIAEELALTAHERQLFGRCLYEELVATLLSKLFNSQGSAIRRLALDTIEYTLEHNRKNKEAIYTILQQAKTHILAALLNSPHAGDYGLAERSLEHAWRIWYYLKTDKAHRSTTAAKIWSKEYWESSDLEPKKRSAAQNIFESATQPSKWSEKASELLKLLSGSGKLDFFLLPASHLRVSGGLVFEEAAENSDLNRSFTGHVALNRHSLVAITEQRLSENDWVQVELEVTWSQVSSAIILTRDVSQDYLVTLPSTTDSRSRGLNPLMPDCEVRFVCSRPPTFNGVPVDLVEGEEKHFVSFKAENKNLKRLQQILTTRGVAVSSQVNRSPKTTMNGAARSQTEVSAEEHGDLQQRAHTGTGPGSSSDNVSSEMPTAAPCSSSHSPNNLQISVAEPTKTWKPDRARTDPGDWKLGGFLHEGVPIEVKYRPQNRDGDGSLDETRQQFRFKKDRFDPSIRAASKAEKVQIIDQIEGGPSKHEREALCRRVVREAPRQVQGYRIGNGRRSADLDAVNAGTCKTKGDFQLSCIGPRERSTPAQSSSSEQVHQPRTMLLLDERPRVELALKSRAAHSSKDLRKRCATDLLEDTLPHRAKRGRLSNSKPGSASSLQQQKWNAQAQVQKEADQQVLEALKGLTELIYHRHRDRTMTVAHSFSTSQARINKVAQQLCIDRLVTNTEQIKLGSGILSNRIRAAVSQVQALRAHLSQDQS